MDGGGVHLAAADVGAQDCRSPSALAGTVRLAALIQGWQAVRHDTAQPIARLPLPGRDHPARSVAVSLFSFSLRDAETILAARGIVVSYETIREWACALTPFRQRTEAAATSGRQLAP